MMKMSKEQIQRLVLQRSSADQIPTIVMRRREVLIRIYLQLRVRKVRVSGQVFKASAPKYTEKKI